MSKNIIITLTEGDHDSAFLARILKANDFNSYKSLIKDFPLPLNEFLKMDILKISIDEVRVEEARRTRFLPSYVLETKDCLVLIYSVGGDTKDAIRIELFNVLDAFFDPDPTAIQPFPDTKFSVLYFLDADEMGIKARCDQIKGELEKCFGPVSTPEEIGNAQSYDIHQLTFGAFIFSDPESGTGKLEDILIPIMKTDNEDVFGEAEKFLSIHEETKIFKGRVSYKDGKIHKVNGQRFDLKKSLVGTIGQLQNSGKSNTVCISDGDYLTNEKIKNDKTCNEIITFITSFIK
jgi:hypothetical protein